MIKVNWPIFHLNEENTGCCYRCRQNAWSQSSIKQTGITDWMNNTTLINKVIAVLRMYCNWHWKPNPALQPHDKDMVVMMHEIEYVLNGEDKVTSHPWWPRRCVLAMAKTVGLLANKPLSYYCRETTGNGFTHLVIIHIHTGFTGTAQHGIVFHE